MLDSAYIAVHVFRDQPHDPYFSDLEELFIQYGGRPHWGKMHTRTASYFATNYEKWQDFEALRSEMDPTGIFLNKHLKGVFGVK
jgi:FAD/FMN-containing dehydrogenase